MAVRAQTGGPLADSAATDTAAASAAPPRSVVLRDTTEQAGEPLEPADDHSPRGALWRSAAVPGWGQFYNEQYYKIPVVYAGLGGLLAFALYSNDQYYLYRNAYRFERGEQFLEDEEITQEEFNARFAQYQSASTELQDFIDANGGNISALRSRRQTFRRYRDLSFIGLGVFYALTLVDAYVSAQLRSFDVGENLTASAVAHFQDGPSMALRVRF